MTRIWITGVGAVTALGGTATSTWERLIAGARGFSPVTLFDTTGHRSNLAGMVKTALPLAGPEWSRTSAMAKLAATEALASARLEIAGRRVGLVVAGTTGGMFETESLLADLHTDPNAPGAWEAMLSHPLTATGDVLDRDIGPFVRSRTLASACSSGANALIVAAAWLRSGEVDAVVAGAAEGLCRLTYSGFHALAALEPEMCRPFDVRRKGLTLGEGAGFLVLERDRDAMGRGAAPIAELAGWALGSEAHHITNPEETGSTAARLIRRAVDRAGLSMDDVEYVNAHGTGTPLNDAMETRALHAAFGARVMDVRVSSSKGQLGHTLGASGAIEAILAAFTVSRGVVPPTMGLEEVDPACRLRHVRSAETANIDVVLSSSFGFGGMDTVLAITKPGRGRSHATTARKVRVVAAASLEHGEIRAVGGASIDVETAAAALDPAKARRLDRTARLPLSTTIAARDAMQPAVNISTNDQMNNSPPLDAGIVWGSAFGRVDASAGYMRRLFDKGPRFASPADFPNLVPSSPAGHASIYLGARGPVLNVADLATSAESAVLQAIELIEWDEADRMAAGAVEQPETIVRTVLGKLFGASSSAIVEAGGIVWLEAREPERAGQSKAIADIARAMTWRREIPDLPRPTANDQKTRWMARTTDARVAEAIRAAGWSDEQELVPVDIASDAAGGATLVEAIRVIALGEVREVLVVGAAQGRGYAFLLVRPS